MPWPHSSFIISFEWLKLSIRSFSHKWRHFPLLPLLINSSLLLLVGSCYWKKDKEQRCWRKCWGDHGKSSPWRGLGITEIPCWGSNRLVFTVTVKSTHSDSHSERYFMCDRGKSNMDEVGFLTFQRRVSRELLPIEEKWN